jgi:hypothetical protein
LSGENNTPASETPAPASAEVAAPAPESAAPAAEAEGEFLADATESEAKPSTESKADDEAKAKPEGEADDFLAETDDDDAEGKADAPGDAKPESAAEAYQPFTLPEGTTLDEALVAEATPIFRKLNLDQDGAQELVSFYAAKTQSAVEAYHATLADNHQATLRTWESELKAMPEYKGAGLKEAKVRVVRALDALGGPEVRKILGDGREGYGLVRNPHVFKFLDAIGTKLSPDSLVRDDAGTPAKETPMRKADVLYS